MVKKEGLLYDYGCILNKYGYYGRPDYRSRDTFSLHSWYLLLWTNFGAFCVALLTKHTALEEMRGNLTSYNYIYYELSYLILQQKFD